MVETASAREGDVPAGFPGDHAPAIVLLFIDPAVAMEDEARFTPQAALPSFGVSPAQRSFQHD
jgi:hypothetical protein